MSDSEAVDIDLDTFEKDLYAPPGEPGEAEAQEKAEVPEPTPSATENESVEAEAEESEDPEEAEDGEDAPEETDEPEEEAKPKPKKRRSAQERIDELTTDKYDLLRRIQTLETLVEKAKSEDPTPKTVIPSPEGIPQPNAMKEDGTPLYPLGEFDPQFITDLNRHVVRKEWDDLKKEDAAKAENQKIEEARNELTTAWRTKVEASAERLPNLEQKFEVLQDTFKGLPPEQGDFIASSIMMLENGPDVLDYFADNLDEAKSLVSSGLFETIIALGRIDGEFSSAHKAKEVDKGNIATKATQAPPPPPRTKGSASIKTIRPDTPNLDDFETLFYQS